MTRQQTITLQQVAAKYNDAVTRSMRWLDRAMNAEDDDSFKRFMNESSRAAHDAEVWHKVLQALKGM